MYVYSFYKFQNIARLLSIKKDLLNSLKNLKVMGTILLSPEGINVNMSQSEKNLDKAVKIICNMLNIDGFHINKSVSDLKDFWLIDPIDGTYDYINNLEEFTINAGLILNKKPAAGLIYAPAKKRMFYSFGENSSYELINNKPVKLECSNNFDKNKIKFVSYSNKIKPEIEKIHKKLNVKECFKMKSSLKFCVIAAGEFDGYVADPRAYEWDIAAGHAILKHAGGSVTDFDNKEILYGKKDYKNPSLILKSKNLL